MQVNMNENNANISCKILKRAHFMVKCLKKIRNHQAECFIMHIFIVLYFG